MRWLVLALVSVARRGAAPPAPARGRPTNRQRATREPLTLLDDGALPAGAVIDVSPVATVGDARSTDLGPSRRSRSRLRRVADMVLLIGLGLAVVVAYEAMDTGGSAADGAADRAVRPVTIPYAVKGPYPLLVAPAAARPGEVVTLLGYRYRDLSGELMVFLDGAPVAHEVTAVINAPFPGRDGVVLTLAVPATISPGVHKLELTGPRPGEASRGGELRDDAEQHYGRIATAKITIAPPNLVE